MEEPKKLLTVKNLSITFGTGASVLRAVDGISFDLYRRETLGIVGESGSGKSVTALALMRLLPGAQVSGQVHFAPSADASSDLLSLAPGEIRLVRGRRIAMIFQEPMTALNPVLSCGEQVGEAIRLHQQLDGRRLRTAALELLDRVHLPDTDRIFDAYPHELSGGQKQRIMIAIALAGNPDILIADEPTTALDVTVQKAILELIQELRRAWDGAVLFISHDLGVIAEVADRVLVMQTGKIVEEGTVREVFTRPEHPYTKGLLACRPPLDYRPRRLPVVQDFLSPGEAAATPSSVTEVVSPEESRQRLRLLMDQQPLLSVRQLHTWFPTRYNWWGRPTKFVKAVDGVSFDVYPGETLGLVGESGCGKTTLGRSVLHLIKPRSGQVSFDGKDLTTSDQATVKNLRKSMQMIFQDPYSSLNPRKRVGEAILEPMQVHRMYGSDAERRERAHELLEIVGLEPDHFNRYPFEFSGGQRQRICIARALAVNPRFIICDEAVSALDVSVQAQVLNLLMELREQYGLTMIFISHDLSVVKVMSDRLMVMNQGRVEEIGPAADVYRNPASPYTQKLIEAIPRPNLDEVL